MKIINKEYDKKIYAFLFGIIVGTILFNMTGVDFSFSDINKFQIIRFGKSYIFITLYLLKFLIFNYLLSFLSIKEKIYWIMSVVLGIEFSGIITMAVQSRKLFVIYGVVIVIIKALLVFTIFESEHSIKNITETIIFAIVGSLLTNILIFI